MSVSKWRYSESCDGDVCVGDCDLCTKEDVKMIPGEELLSAQELYLGFNLYEEKLKTLMPEKEYGQFVEFVARQMFKATLNRMPDGEFKDFVLEKFEEIIRDEAD